MIKTLQAHRIFLVIWLVLAAWLGGCAQVQKVEAGSAAIGDRLIVELDGAWNRLSQRVVPTAITWTVEGIEVDLIHFFVGIKDDSVLAPTATGRTGDSRPLTFRAHMAPQEITALVQTMLTRDGSLFTLNELSVVDFLGGKGFKMSYGLTRKGDGVRLQGLVYAAVRGDELFLILYSAPRLGFYPRYAPQVEQMMKSARLK